MSLIPARGWPTTARSFAAIGIDPELPRLQRRPEGGIDYDWSLARARGLPPEAYLHTFGRIGHAIGAATSGLIHALSEWRTRRRALAELLSMDDRGLRDLGLGRSSVYFAVDHGREDIEPANVN